MKKLFIAALLFVGMVSFAQDNNQKATRDQREKLTPEQRNEKHLQKLTSDLNLDKKQQEQVKQLIEEKSAKAEKFKEARKDSKAKPTDAEREAFKKQMIAEKEATDAQMKSILTADQYTKWTALKKESKDHRGKGDHKGHFKSPQERDQAHLQKLTTDLNLNADQQKQVSELLSDRSTKMAMLKKSRKDSTVQPTEAEKKAMKKQMEENHKAYDAKMKSILTADQYTKWTAIQKEHKDKMKEHRKDKK